MTGSFHILTTVCISAESSVISSTDTTSSSNSPSVFFTSCDDIPVTRRSPTLTRHKDSVGLFVKRVLRLIKYLLNYAPPPHFHTFFLLDDFVLSAFESIPLVDCFMILFVIG